MHNCHMLYLFCASATIIISMYLYRWSYGITLWEISTLGKLNLVLIFFLFTFTITIHPCICFAAPTAHARVFWHSMDRTQMTVIFQSYIVHFTESTLLVVVSSRVIDYFIRVYCDMIFGITAWHNILPIIS